MVVVTMTTSLMVSIVAVFAVVLMVVMMAPGVFGDKDSRRLNQTGVTS
jgi:hypothetical protein